jgi:hypothetical protein
MMQFTKQTWALAALSFAVVTNAAEFRPRGNYTGSSVTAEVADDCYPVTTTTTVTATARASTVTVASTITVTPRASTVTKTYTTTCYETDTVTKTKTTTKEYVLSDQKCFDHG